MKQITDLFGIQYPIIAGGMVWCSGWELTAAVSNCGGLGLIGAGSMTPEILREHIQKCKKNTDKPFGVNLPLLSAHAEQHVAIIIEEKVPIVFSSAGNPALWTPKFKEAGIKVVHVVANVKFAKKAADANVDAIVAEGFEAGGHNGKEETATLVLIPEIAKAVNIPIIAAGGIATGEQMYAALSLGASGVQIGTRFAVSEESSAHPTFKQAVVEAKEGDTKLFFRKLSPTRLLKGGFFTQVQEAESKGASAEELLDIIGRERSRKGMFEGNLQEGELEIGQVASAITKIEPVSSIMKDLVQSFMETKKRMNSISF